MASLEFLRVTFRHVVSDDERRRVRSDLDAYCGRDTMGMAEIFDVLQKICRT